VRLWVRLRGMRDNGLLDELVYIPGGLAQELLPSPDEQVALVERTFAAASSGRVQLPPKIPIHPRRETFIHAMPAYLADEDVAALKWIGGSTLNRARGLPYLSGLIIVNDPESGAVTAILEGAAITAARTAAVSALCIGRLGARSWQKVAIIGFGVQGVAHCELLRAMNPTAEFIVWNGGSNRSIPRLRRIEATISLSAREAVHDADVVITSVPLARPAHPILRPDWLKTAALILPIDFDATVGPSVVREAALFVVDDIEQFEYYRNLGHFTDWPSPDRSLADSLGDVPPGQDRIVCCNLGVGSLDAAFAHSVLERAQRLGAGLRLPR